MDESPESLEGQVRALAQRYMKINCACFTENTGRANDILRMVKDYKVDGVIDCNLQFCGLYSTESFLIKETLKKESIPYLHLETDYNSQDAGQLRTRVQAFMEILQ